MKSSREWLESIAHKEAKHPQDGVITHVFNTHVHVRLKGSHRRIVTNVAIADHIDKRKLAPGKYCKISSLYERSDGRNGRFILTDILPVTIYDGVYVSSAAAKPNPPRVTARLDCTETAWYISWENVSNALSYKLYVAIDADGTSAQLLVDTTNLNYSLPFTADGYVFFAVIAVGSAGDSAHSNWVTDNAYFSDTGIVAFGDDGIHGDLISSQVRFKIVEDESGVRTVLRSENHGASWPYDITPTAVYADWGDITDLTEIEYTQIIASETLSLVFGKWENLSGEMQGWFWSSLDLGGTWTAHTIRPGSATEAFPIWADVGSTNLYLTIWSDGNMYLQVYALSDLTTVTATENLGAVTKAQVISKEYFAYPVSVAADEIYIAGRFII